MVTIGSNRWRWLLIPFSWLYGLVIIVRNRLYNRGVFISNEFPIPLISVGNLAIGGTGKTPHIEYLVELLKTKYRVATLSRGYMRKTKDFRMVTTDSTSREVGDEPLQIKTRYPDITVAVDRDRVHGVQKLMNLEPDIDAVLLDDAYQHRSIRPGFSMVLMDYHRPVFNDLLLPAGRLREPARNLNRADMVVVTRSPGQISDREKQHWRDRLKLSPRQALHFTAIRYGAFVPVFGKRTLALKKDRIYMEGGPVEAMLLLTGIAHPKPLKEYLSALCPLVRSLNFPDHHDFSLKNIHNIAREFKQLKDKHLRAVVLTTEKDAMRLRSRETIAALRKFESGTALQERIHAVRIHIHFPDPSEKNFDHQILEYVGNQ